MTEFHSSDRPSSNVPHETDPNRKITGSPEPAKGATPFDHPLRSCGEVLHAHVPAVQEATFLIQRALGSGPGGFRAERMMTCAAKIFAEFRVALKMLELAQAKMLHETRRTAPRKSRVKNHERTSDNADRRLDEHSGFEGAITAAPETAPHPDRRKTADLAGTPTDGAAQASAPIPGGDAEVCAGD